jgi:hypothetical protein
VLLEGVRVRLLLGERVGVKVRVPEGVGERRTLIFRMRWLPPSATITLPLLSNVTPRGS